MHYEDCYDLQDVLVELPLNTHYELSDIEMRAYPVIINILMHLGRFGNWTPVLEGNIFIKKSHLSIQTFKHSYIKR